VVTRTELDAVNDQIWMVEQLTEDVLRAGPDELDDVEHRVVLTAYLGAIQALLADRSSTSANAGNPRSVKFDP
jgi:hypothetical protein